MSTTTALPPPTIDDATLGRWLKKLNPVVRAFMLVRPRSEPQSGFFLSHAVNRWLIGVNKAGKTFCGTIDTIAKATSRYPWAIQQAGAPNRWRFYEGAQQGRHLILASTLQQMAGASLRELERWLSPADEGGWLYKRYARDNIWVVCRFNKDGTWVRKPGHEIFLRSVEQGRSAIQGNEYDTVWLDEEPEDDRVTSELGVMMEPRQGTQIGTLTPIATYEGGGVSKLADTIINPALKGTLDPAQTAVFFVKAGDQIDAAGERWSSDRVQRLYASIAAEHGEAEARLRVFGEFLPFSGAAIFPPAHLRLQASKVRPPLMRGDLIGRSFQPAQGGALCIWRMPERKRSYVIFADSGGGDSGGTFSVAQVLDRETGHQVARFRMQIDPKQYGYVLNDLGRWYNDALLAPEANPGGGGGTVISTLLDLHYPNLLRRPDPPGVRRNAYAKRPTMEKFGFYTSGQKGDGGSRVELIASLRKALLPRRDGSAGITIHDEVTLGELYLFQRDEKGKIKAPRGRYDDCVLSIAGAAWVLENTPGDRPEVAPPPKAEGWNVACEAVEQFEKTATKRMDRERANRDVRLTGGAPAD